MVRYSLFFAFALVLSDLLLGTTLPGAAVFLYGLVGITFFSNLKRGSMMTRGRLWCCIAFYIAILFANILMMQGQSNRPEAATLWKLMTALVGMVVSCGAADSQGMRENSQRKKWLPILLQLICAIGGAAALLSVPRLHWSLVCIYPALITLNTVSFTKQSGLPLLPESDEIRAIRNAFLQGNAFRKFERLSVLAKTGAFLTVVLICCSLPMTADRVAATLGFAIFCGVVSAWLAGRIYRWNKKKSCFDAARTGRWGLFFWLVGLVVFGRRTDFTLHSVFLRNLGAAICAFGTSLTLLCLKEADCVIRSSVGLYAAERSSYYPVIAGMRNRTAVLIGGLATLLLMTVSVALNGKDGLNQAGCPALLRLSLLIATVLLLPAVFFGLLRLPVGRRYARKLERLLTIEAAGGTNRSLRQQMEDMFVREYHCPVGINMILSVLRPFVRHQLKDADRIAEDDENPIVFLCNHGEFYGPLASVLNLPVHIRPWVISQIAGTPEEFAEYFNRFTMSKVKWVPDLWKMPICRKIGKLSVWAAKELDAIPVFRDTPMKLIFTMRQTAAALEAGDNILLFPENPNAKWDGHGYEREGVGPLFDGFVVLAEAYYRKTSKRCRFLPMFADQNAKTLSIGREILFDPDAEPKGERARISDEVKAQMEEIYQRGKQSREGRQ